MKEGGPVDAITQMS